MQQRKEKWTLTETKPSLSLRPGATEFIPSSSLPPPSTGSDSGGTGVASYTELAPNSTASGPGPCSLRWSVLAWHAYFGMHNNHWNKEEKATL